MNMDSPSLLHFLLLPLILSLIYIFCLRFSNHNAPLPFNSFIHSFPLIVFRHSERSFPLSFLPTCSFISSFSSSTILPSFSYNIFFPFIFYFPSFTVLSSPFTHSFQLTLSFSFIHIFPIFYTYSVFYFISFLRSIPQFYHFSSTVYFSS